MFPMTMKLFGVVLDSARVALLLLLLVFLGIKGSASALEWEMIHEEAVEFGAWRELDIEPLQGLGVILYLPPAPVRLLSRGGEMLPVSLEVLIANHETMSFGQGIAVRESEERGDPAQLPGAWDAWVDERVPPSTFDTIEKLQERRLLRPYLWRRNRPDSFRWWRALGEGASYALIGGTMNDEFDRLPGDMRFRAFVEKLGGVWPSTPTVLMDRKVGERRVIVFEAYSRGATNVLLHPLPRESGCLLLLDGGGWIYDRGRGAFEKFKIPSSSGGLDYCIEGENLLVAVYFEESESESFYRLYRASIYDLVPPPQRETDPHATNKHGLATAP